MESYTPRNRIKENYSPPAWFYDIDPKWITGKSSQSKENRITQESIPEWVPQKELHPTHGIEAELLSAEREHHRTIAKIQRECVYEKEKRWKIELEKAKFTQKIERILYEYGARRFEHPNTTFQMDNDINGWIDPDVPPKDWEYN